MASSYKPRFTTTLNAAARASSAAQAETMILLLSRFDDLSTMTDPVASRKSSASIMESYIRALATATPAARSPRVVVVPTAAKRVAAATSTVLADPERLGMGSADLAVDIGMTVFWVVVGLVWLKVAKMRRDGRLPWHISLLAWMEGVVQETLATAFECGRAVVGPGWKIGRVCVRFGSQFGSPVATVWVGYRVVWFFAKEWWERENRVDHHLAIGLHLLSCLLIAVGPVGILFALLNRFIRHHDAVEVCNLCGNPSSCKQMHDIDGSKFGAGDLLDPECRITQGLQAGPEQRSDGSGKKHDLQKASTLPSGLRFSPAPWVLPPPRPTAFDRLCNSAAGGVRCSGSRRRIPGLSRRQHTFNALEANRSFTTSMNGEDEILAVGTKRMDEIWGRMPHGLEPEARRFLWSHISSNPATKTPFKRFL